MAHDMGFRKDLQVRNLLIVLDASELGSCAARPPLFAGAFLGVFSLRLVHYTLMMSAIVGAWLPAGAPFVTFKLDFNCLLRLGILSSLALLHSRRFALP